MQLTLEQLVIPPGSQLLVNIDWATFEALLDESASFRPPMTYPHHSS